MDWRGQLKVVSVKLTYALLGYVSFNDELTVDLSVSFDDFKRTYRRRNVNFSLSIAAIV